MIMTKVYAYTTLINTIFSSPLHKIDTFTSLSNGICFEDTSKCLYIDSVYHNTKNWQQCYSKNVLFSNITHPGAKAFDILNVLKNQYVYEFVFCKTVNGRKVYETYNNWEILINGTTLTFVVYYNETVLPPDGSADLTFWQINTEVDIGPLPLGQISLKNWCPAHGFNLTNGVTCGCIQPLRDHGYICDVMTGSLTSRQGYWTGFTDSGGHKTVYFDDTCPPNYCNITMKNFTLDEKLNYTSCRGKRYGTLCGKCQKNYSLIFGSDDCHLHCSDLYLLTVPAYALAGFLLVVILFISRLTVASGIVNGGIFYANVLGLVIEKLTESATANHVILWKKYVFKIVFVVVSLLNLNLGFPLCFYEGMSPSVKVGLQFVFPVYLWCLVLALVIISRHSTRVSNLISNSSVQVLATLFYLSFSKLLQTVITIFTYSSYTAIIEFQNGSFTSAEEKLIWYYNGEVDFGHGIHGVLLFLAGTFTVLFLFPYTMLLTLSFFFTRYSVVNRFKPLLDAYGCPFHDKWRFWFGLRLWVTIALFIISGTLEGSNTNNMFLAHIVIILIFILLQGLVRPFKKMSTGVIDVGLMLVYWITIELYFSRNDLFVKVYPYLSLITTISLCLVWVYHLKLQRFCKKTSCLEKQHRYQLLLNENDNATEREEDADYDLYTAAEERAVDSY